MRVVEIEAMDARADERLTADEFLEWMAGPSAPEGRWELVAGVPVRMMVNVRRKHSTVVGNMLATLHRQLRNGPCRPHAEAFAVRVGESQVRFPDVLVDCGSGDDDDLHASEPKVIVEVLSDGTKNFDKSRKLEEYQSIPSVHHIVFVETGLADVSHFIRDGHSWERHDLNQLADVLELTAVKAAVSLIEIYEGVDVPPPLPRLRVVRDD